MQHTLKSIKGFTLSKRWFGWLMGLVLVALALLLQEAVQIQHQIQTANQQVAASHVRVAILEAWVHAQIAFPQQGLTPAEAQAINPTFPPKLEAALLNADANAVNDMK